MTRRCPPNCDGYHPTRRDVLAARFADVAFRFMTPRTRRLVSVASASAVADEIDQTHRVPVGAILPRIHPKAREVDGSDDPVRAAVEQKFGKAGADYLHGLRAEHPDGLLAEAVAEVERQALLRSRRACP